MKARRVLFVQYTNPAAYPPLEHSAWLLAEAGFEARLLGTTSALGDAIRLRPHPRISVLLLPFRQRGVLQKLHYIWFTIRVLIETLRWQPSWVYASDPLSCPAVMGLTWLPGVCVIYHEHDSPSRTSAQGLEGTGFMRRVMRARRTLARRSAICVLPNACRAKALCEDTGRQDVLTVWNCPMRAEIIATLHEVTASSMRVFYHGSIVPARLPATVLHAIARLSTVEFVFAGYETAGHPGYVDSLLSLAEQLGVADRVRYLGTVPERAQLLRECSACDVGLALMPHDSSDLNEQAMVGASNKPFDYLACGLALVVSDRPDWRDTFVEAGLAKSCDPRSSESIAVALGWLLDHPRERASMGERGRQRILADWNYDSQFQPVMKRMLAGASVDVSAVEAPKNAETTSSC